MSSPTKEPTPTPQEPKQEPKQERPRWQPRPPPTQEERYHDEIRNLIYAFAILLKCTAFYVVCQGIRAIIELPNRVALARIAAKSAVGR